MRAALAAWAHARWPDCRVVHELTLGDGRIDLAFVCRRDIVGVEIKSSRDRLDRLHAQVREYRRFLPEVWVAVAPKWNDHAKHGHHLVYADHGNRLVVADGRVDCKRIGKPYRDELVVSRMLELLWRDEAARIAQRTDVIPGTRPCGEPRYRILPMLARLLTGNDIMREVCTELRARSHAGGYQSERAIEGEAAYQPKRHPLKAGAHG